MHIYTSQAKRVSACTGDFPWDHGHATFAFMLVPGQLLADAGVCPMANGLNPCGHLPETFT